MKVKLEKTPSGSLILLNARIAYPALYTPESFKGDDKNTPRYGVTVLVPKDQEDVVDRLNAEINKLAKEKFKLSKLPAADSCFRDGDEKANAAYHGNMVLTAYAYPSSKKLDNGAPQVVSRSKRPIKEGSPDAPYSGCRCNVMFDLYTPNNWKKVSAGLLVVQFVGHDEPIGAVVDTSALPDLPEDDDFEA